MIDSEDVPVTVHVPAAGVARLLLISGEDQAAAAAAEMEALIEAWREQDAYGGSDLWASRLADGSVTFLWNVDRDDVMPLLTDKRLQLAK